MARGSGAPADTGVAVGDHDHLADPGHGPQGRGTEGRRLGGDVAPGQHAEVLLGGQLGEAVLGLGRVVGVGGEEDHARGVAAGARAARRAGRRSGSGGASGPGSRPRRRWLGLGAGGAPVGEVLEGGDGLAHQGVAAPPVEVGHERDTAGVVLERGVVQARGRVSAWSSTGYSVVRARRMGGMVRAAARDDAGPAAVLIGYMAVTRSYDAVVVGGGTIGLDVCLADGRAGHGRGPWSIPTRAGGPRGWRPGCSRP